jgi:hypothetical protein
MNATPHLAHDPDVVVHLEKKLRVLKTIKLTNLDMHGHGQDKNGQQKIGHGSTGNELVLCRTP